MSGTDAKPITALLNRWNAGDEDALAELTPVVYDELRARCLFKQLLNTLKV